MKKTCWMLLLLNKIVCLSDRGTDCKSAPTGKILTNRILINLISFDKKRIMETLKIEIKNKNVISILKGLEKAKLIRLIGRENKTSLSDLKGSLSKTRANELASEIEKSRSEWHERTI